jgi:arabinose-5-phosphate isomerase
VNIEELITKTALDTIHIEAQTLESLKASINTSFCNCVQTIYQSKGRVIVTGIGKSALVGQKITATLNSTGTPSAFMHAADAIHGDLGMVSPDDLVLCLSKSGETPEIKALVPLVKNLGNPLIAVVGNASSFLARQATFLLLTPIDKEADPNNLAPTASTTAQMALGDALATALLALRGFTPRDFAQFHPGGSLGKQLYLRVRDLFPQNEKPTVHPRDQLSRVIVEMTSKRLGATAVIDKDQYLLGIITDGDLRRMLEKGTDFNGITAADIMTKSPKTIAPEAMAVDAFRLMQQHSITQIIVTENEKYLGIVHLHDLIREGMI